MELDDSDLLFEMKCEIVMMKIIVNLFCSKDPESIATVKNRYGE
jgi:hypothetical protein